MKLIAFFESINEASPVSTPLYHAISADRASNALISNSLGGYTTQRFWPDGKRRRENDPGYENSWWYKGISTTRDLRYAAKWNYVVFEFDKNKLNQKYKIIPYAWNYHMSDSPSPFPNDHFRHKIEKEEFVITGKMPPFMTPLSNEFDELPEPEQDKHIELFNTFTDKPIGKIEPLDKFLTGIYVTKELDGYHFRNSPLFKGILRRETRK